MGGPGIGLKKGRKIRAEPRNKNRKGKTSAKNIHYIN